MEAWLNLLINSQLCTYDTNGFDDDDCEVDKIFHQNVREGV
jgi:hypothetical protein